MLQQDMAGRQITQTEEMLAVTHAVPGTSNTLMFYSSYLKYTT